MVGESADLTSFGRYSRDTLRVLFAARQELAAAGGEAVSPEHLLLALLGGAAPAGFPADRTLAEALRAEVRAALPQTAVRGDADDLPLDERAKAVLERALSATAGRVETAHLLLAILTEGSGVAASALAARGITAARVQAALQG